jgi:AraC-like DNA-binding protein
LEDFFCFLFPLQGEQWLQQHDDRYIIEPGKVFAIDPMRKFNQVISPEHRMINVRVDRMTFDTFLQGAINRYPSEPLAFTKAPVNISSATSLFEFVQFLCRDCEGETGAANDAYHDLAARQMERSLLALLLATLPNNYQEVLNATLQQPSNLIKDAEAFIRRNLTDPITVSDMAAATGVSERSIYYAFANHYRMSPLKFLKNERLKLARSMLQRQDGRHLSVCDVAMACGFNHLSKFSSDYRKRFGELPRETLKGVG